MAAGFSFPVAPVVAAHFAQLLLPACPAPTAGGARWSRQGRDWPGAPAGRALGHMNGMGLRMGRGQHPGAGRAGGARIIG